MLQNIRDHAQGWIAWVIVGLIILTFALFGVEQYAQGEKKVIVAEVNDEDITALDFLSLYGRQKEQLQNKLGDKYNETVKDDELRSQVLEALIVSSSVQQYAKKQGTGVSDEQLAQIIHSAPVFQKEGKFDQELYESILLKNNFNVARFEYEQRRVLTGEQFRQTILSSSFTTQTELEQIMGLEAQKRNIGYLKVSYLPYLKKLQISEDEIKSYYEKNKNSFIESDKVSINYVTLAKNDIEKTLKPTDFKIKEYYEMNKETYIQPEERRASHILIKVDGKDKTSKDKAKKSSENILKRLNSGENFAKLAKELSQDSGSAQKGGDLGFFKQGFMVKTFDEAVFSMKKNTVKGPIESDFGYHIIKLLEIKSKKTTPFNEIKEQVKQQLIEELADKKYYELLDKLTTAAYEQSNSLEPAANSISTTIKQSGLFSKNKPIKNSITSNDKVVKAAFSDEVFKNNENSSVIEISDGVSIVLRINNKIPSKQLVLSEVKLKIENVLLEKKSKAKSKEYAMTLLEKLKDGVDGAKLVNIKEGIEWNELKWIARNNVKGLNLDVLKAAFKVAKPTKENSTWNTIVLTNGDSAVIQVAGVKTGTITDKNKQSQLKKALSNVLGNAEITALVQSIVKSAEVTRHDAYKTLKSN